MKRLIILIIISAQPVLATETSQDVGNAQFTNEADFAYQVKTVDSNRKSIIRFDSNDPITKNEKRPAIKKADYKLLHRIHNGNADLNRLYVNISDDLFLDERVTQGTDRAFVKTELKVFTTDNKIMELRKKGIAVQEGVRCEVRRYNSHKNSMISGYKKVIDQNLWKISEGISKLSSDKFSRIINLKRKDGVAMEVSCVSVESVVRHDGYNLFVEDWVETEKVPSLVNSLSTLSYKPSEQSQKLPGTTSVLNIYQLNPVEAKVSADSITSEYISANIPRVIRGKQ